MISDAELVRAALEARERAYAPYSRFHVGAALLTAGGRVFSGANVENASYGLSLCAERVAVFKAVSEGEREFLKIAIVCPGSCRPCGACRQVLAEFAPELWVICADPQGHVRAGPLSELLPEPFLPEHLDISTD